jgi:hypothetical protein
MNGKVRKLLLSRFRCVYCFYRRIDDISRNETQMYVGHAVHRSIPSRDSIRTISPFMSGNSLPISFNMFKMC